MSDTPYGRLLASLARITLLPEDEGGCCIDRAATMREVCNLRVAADDLERENADLRSDIERHVRIASEQATEMAALREDLADLERQACTELAELRAKLKAAPRDAERFRWWLSKWAAGEDELEQLNALVWDGDSDSWVAAIDAAMQEGK